jgi:DNA-binding transcriptional ArsR family regulator
MTAQYSLADVAALIGEPTRAAMLLALLDGRALPATELAAFANISASTTSLHLAKLVQGGLLAVRKAGRHRYYRLASVEAAHALEALGVIATAAPPSRPISHERAVLRAARTCYDHLAGALSVTLALKLEHAHVLRVADELNYEVTARGKAWFFDALHIDIATLARTRRPLARRCLDWTERRPHIAGALGAAILEEFLARRWVVKTAGSRALRVTSRGSAGVEGLPPQVACLRLALDRPVP